MGFMILREKRRTTLHSVWGVDEEEEEKEDGGKKRDAKMTTELKRKF